MLHTFNIREELLWHREAREGVRGKLPSEGDLDGRGEAGGEEVSREVGVHGQQLAGLAGSQLDAVLHGGRQGHLGERVAGIDSCHLNRHIVRMFVNIYLAATTT